MTASERSELDALIEASVRAATKAETSEAANFTLFKFAMWRNYRHAAHLAVIDDALMQVSRFVETNGSEGIRKLAIFIPPRHGKSQSVSRLYPAWFLGRNPDKMVILAGYGADLVHKHSRVARNIVLSADYQNIFPTVRVADDSAARHSWSIAGRDGGMEAMGIDGGVTGKGAHVLIIDDAHKNRAEAESKTKRDAVWKAYADDFYTRLEPAAAVVLIMTRWHQDDLAGRLLENEGAEWHVIRLPALAEEGDPLDRSLGEALWPERYPIESLMDRRATLGAYSFSALYQQSPTNREGSLFKWAWIDGAEGVESPRLLQAPPLSRVVIAVDPAASSGGDEHGIIAAGATSGKDSHGYVLEDASLRGSPDQWARAAIALYYKYRAQAIVIETNQGGEMATNTLRTIDKTVRIREVKATTGKVLRAEPVAALYEQGRVHHVGEFPALEDQMTGWTPNEATSPDRLDALVWALTELMLKPAGVGLR